MSAFEEIRNERLKKLELLKEKGVNAFPISVKKSSDISEILGDFEKLLEKKKLEYCRQSYGRKSARRFRFFDLNDGTGKIQAYIKKTNSEKKSFLCLMTRRT